MNKWIKILLALVIVGALAAYLVFRFYINKPHADIEKATPAYTMAADALWKEYNADMKLSDSLYTGKVLELTGALSRVDIADSLTIAVFVMEADSMFGDKSIRCEMLATHGEATRALAPGTAIKVKGYCTGYDMTDIKLNKCSIVK